MAALNEERKLDVVGAFLGMVVAGAVAALSNSLEVVGTLLVALGGAAVGVGIVHLRSSKLDRLPAYAFVIAGLVAGLAGVVFFQQGTSTGSQPPTSDVFLDPDTVVVAPPDTSVAYPADAPPSAGVPGLVVTSELQPSGIVNRGIPEVVDVVGGNATAHGQLEIILIAPDGSQTVEASAWADSNGSYSYGLDWRPLAYMGVSGTEGAWTVSVSDLVTGSRAVAQLYVLSTQDTPPAEQWRPDVGLQPVPNVPFSIDVTSAGNMCSGAPAESDVRVHGSTPGGGVTLFYRDPRGRVLVKVGTSTNLRGETGRTSPIFWDTANCEGPGLYEYEVIAVDDLSGRQVRGELHLYTEAGRP
ncbi:hypothetical protein [Microbacterium sp. NPDC087589]|uniref:hypothetical protein n=1 Tax=Microbacterium sp. NPDC087589 TaxID=3364191 RepID=UPI0038268EA7